MAIVTFTTQIHTNTTMVLTDGVGGRDGNRNDGIDCSRSGIVDRLKSVIEKVFFRQGNKKGLGGNLSQREEIGQASKRET